MPSNNKINNICIHKKRNVNEPNVVKIISNVQCLTFHNENSVSELSGFLHPYKDQMPSHKFAGTS